MRIPMGHQWDATAIFFASPFAFDGDVPLVLRSTYPRLYSVTVVLHLSTANMYLNLGRALSHFYFIGPFCMPCIIIIVVPIEIDIEYAYSILINFIDYSLLCALLVLSIILYNYI